MFLSHRVLVQAAYVSGYTPFEQPFKADVHGSMAVCQKVLYVCEFHGVLSITQRRRHCLACVIALLLLCVRRWFCKCFHDAPRCFVYAIYNPFFAK